MVGLSVIVFKNPVLESVNFVNGFGGGVVDLSDFCGMRNAHPLQVYQLQQLETSFITHEFVLFSHFCFAY